MHDGTPDVNKLTCVSGSALHFNRCQSLWAHMQEQNKQISGELWPKWANQLIFACQNKNQIIHLKSNYLWNVNEVGVVYEHMCLPLFMDRYIWIDWICAPQKTV